MADVKLGGWELAEMQACGLPNPVATGFSEVIQHLKGADYTPVLYVGEQVVQGKNYAIICKQRIVVPNGPEHLVEFVINSFQDKWSVVSITRIV